MALTFGELSGAKNGGPHHELVSPGLATLGTFLVNACGRHLNVPLQAGCALVDLQSAMQEMLQMQGQNFVFSDSTGVALRSNDALFDAVQQGRSPISATLSDASIHFIENRREELAQMQWKLVRDKMTSLETDSTMLARQMSELKDQLAQSKQEAATKGDILKSEISRMVQDGLAQARASNAQISENVTAFAHLAKVEKETRASAMQHVQQQLQEVHQFLDNERSFRERQFEQNLSTLREGKVALEAQKELHRSLEKQTTFELDTMRAELAKVAKHFNALENDQVRSFKHTVDAVAAKTLQNSNEIARLAALDEKLANHFNLISDIEARSDILDRRLTDASNQQSERFDRISDRQEKVGALLDENLRDAKTQKHDLSTVTERFKLLEDGIMGLHDETTRFIQQEGISVRHEIHRSNQQITQEHAQKIADVNSKMMDRLEQESATREERNRPMQDDLTISSPQSASETLGLARPRSVTVPVMKHEHRPTPRNGNAHSPPTSACLSPRVPMSPRPSSRLSGSSSSMQTACSAGGSVALPVFPGNVPAVPIFAPAARGMATGHAVQLFHPGSPRSGSATRSPRRTQQVSPQGVMVFHP